MSSDKCWFKILKVDNVYARISTNHPSLISDVYNFLSVYANNYRHMPKYKMGIWDGKIHFMDRTGKFQIGLLKYVYKFVAHDEVDIQIDPELMVRYDPSDLVEITNEWMDDRFVPYHHQMEGAMRALKFQNCILEHATSSGKSLTMAMMMMYNLKKNRCKKILVLVPSIGLIKQLNSEFVEYGIPPDLIGQFCGFQKDTEQAIIIATWQSMCNQPDLVKEFDMLIADETHSLRGKEVRAVVENATNCPIRIGCTGTMPDNKPDMMQIEGALGPVVHQVTARELIDAKQASDIFIKIPYILFPEKDTKEIKGMPYEVEKEWLEKNSKRNEIIKRIISKHTELEQNCLILVEHVPHGKELFEKMKEIPNSEVFLVTGSVDADERERIRKYTNENKKIIIIATYGVFSTGISIKRLHTILFASASKSKIRTLQSIGRGLRLHKEKTRLILYDVADNTKYSEKHLHERIKIYDKAQFELDMFEINLNKD